MVRRIPAKNDLIILLDSRRWPSLRLVDPVVSAPVLQREIGDSKRREIPTLAARNQIRDRVEGRATKLTERVGMRDLVFLVNREHMVGGDTEDGLWRCDHAHRAAAENGLAVDLPPDWCTVRLHD